MQWIRAHANLKRFSPTLHTTGPDRQSWGWETIEIWAHVRRSIWSNWFARFERDWAHQTRLATFLCQPWCAIRSHPKLNSNWEDVTQTLYQVHRISILWLLNEHLKPSSVKIGLNLQTSSVRFELSIHFDTVW